MQIKAINSTNFKGNSEVLALVPMSRDEKEARAMERAQKRSAERAERQEAFRKAQKEEEAASALQFEERLKSYVETVDRANNNVRLATILSSVALALGIMAKGKKVLDPAVKALITAGEAVSKTAVGLAGSVVKKIDKTKVQEKIANTANKLRTDAPNQKMLGGFTGLVDKIFPGKGEKATTTLTNTLGIKNPLDVVKSTLLAGAALAATDKFADNVENALDNAEIEGAKKDLIANGFEVASQFVEALV